jgi:protein-disulfide isomerase
MATETHDSEKKSGGSGSNIWPWALVTGLAVGFLIGREVAPRSGGSAGDDARPSAAAPAAGAPTAAAPVPAKVYKTEAEFPSSWYKSSVFTSVAGLSLDGLSDAQKATAFQALNERNCECGCGRGTLAHCVKTDPGCPKSPKLMKDAVDMARQGKSLGEILAYIDKENPPRGAAPSPQAAAPSPQQAAPVKQFKIPDHAPRKGPKHAKVTVVEFSDFHCPFCASVLPLIKDLTQAYPKDLAVVFINLPLRSIHPQAADAAKAFMAAHRQGKAWEMHDKIFGNPQQARTVADFERLAQELSLNMAKFKKDYADPAVEKMVRDDEALASQVGVGGTPTFFINGMEAPRGRDLASWKPVIDEQIKKADGLLKGGVKMPELWAKITAENAAAGPPKLEVPVGTSPTRGPAKAPVTIVAFSEFQCPFCSRALPGLKEVEEKYKGKVRIAFKNLLIPGHDKAPLAAEAALAAHEQGKFWEYHDKLFANQQQLDRPSLEKYAQELNLNMGKFKAALDSGKHKKQVEEDMKVASTVGATGTPTFFVNGKMHMGAMDFAQWKGIIDGELGQN